jgi:hypothetical protein
MPEIPLSYMRSCLLSPKFYNVVNRVLAKMASDTSVPSNLRLSIVQFLVKLMKIDRDYVSLILADIDLKQFLRANLFFGDASGSQLVVSFLQNFQTDYAFCLSLYQILIDYLDKVPETLL